MHSPDGLNAPQQPTPSHPLLSFSHFPLCSASVCFITRDRLLPLEQQDRNPVSILPEWSLFPWQEASHLRKRLLPNYMPGAQEWGGESLDWGRNRGWWEGAEDEKGWTGGWGEQGHCLYLREPVDVWEMSSIERARVLNGFSGRGK